MSCGQSHEGKDLRFSPKEVRYTYLTCRLPRSDGRRLGEEELYELAQQQQLQYFRSRWTQYHNANVKHAERSDGFGGR